MRNKIRQFIVNTTIIMSLSTGALLGQSTADKIVDDTLYPASEVHLQGYLTGKLDEALENRILAQDVDRLIAPFKLENRTETRFWQSEFWGKWFTSAVSAYRYHPSTRLKMVLNQAVAGLLATQTPDGYIGNYAPDHRLEQWDIWGRKYCMLGLLAYYDLTHDKKSLIGASRIADNLIDDLKKKDGIIVTKGNYRGMAASSVLEPICLLYNATKKKKYLDFALEIVRQWETPQGPQLISKAAVNVSERFPKPKNWYSPEQGQKAYEMMSCYEGLTELYRITGNEAYKKAVLEAWDNIQKSEINIAGSGASTEMWFGGKTKQNLPVNHYQETCVTVTWIKFSEQLLRLTGEVKYADEVERSYYNALLAAMSDHGASWAKYTPLNGQRLPGNEQCGMGLNCCEASGPRGLYSLPAFVMMQQATGIQVNYFSAGNFLLKTPNGQNTKISQNTTYPSSGEVNIEVTIEKPELMDIRIRIPQWSSQSLVTVNNEKIDQVQSGQNLSIKRLWKNGDKISLQLDMRGRVIQSEGPVHSIAIMRGPIVLARDSRFEGTAITSMLKPVMDPQGFIDLTDISKSGNNPYLTCKASFIPESYTESPQGPISITLCDYASAGNGEDHSFFAVWLQQLINPKEQSRDENKGY